MTDTFLRDVDEGLSKTPKSLPSRYFYDEIGDELFVQIMHLKEYYLTRSELEIFKEHTESLVSKLGLAKEQAFDIIELGAGDGKKTRYLLKHLLQNGYNFDYRPVDISHNALDGLKDTLYKEFPTLHVTPIQGEYFEALKKIRTSPLPKIILFLGSNIGNMLDDRAANFIQKLDSHLSTGDRLLLGVDLIKKAEIVVPAYSDSKGVTKAFNLNVLKRINRELGGNFDLGTFDHIVTYDENEGVVRSFLKSTTDQNVFIKKLNKYYSFKKGELINTEISRKYNDQLIKNIISGTRFEIRDKLTDSESLFADYILLRR